MDQVLLEKINSLQEDIENLMNEVADNIIEIPDDNGEEDPATFLLNCAKENAKSTLTFKQQLEVLDQLQTEPNIEERFIEMTAADDGFDGENSEFYKNLKEKLNNALDGTAELQICNTSFRTPIDPITKQLIKNPCKNMICGHVYEFEVVQQMYTVQKGRGKKKKSFKCPYIGCDKELNVNMVQLDDRMKHLISSQSSQKSQPRPNIMSVSLDDSDM